MKKRRVFSREFKLEAVRLLEEGEKPAEDIARELGLKRAFLVGKRNVYMYILNSPVVEYGFVHIGSWDTLYAIK